MYQALQEPTPGHASKRRKRGQRIFTSKPVRPTKSIPSTVDSQRPAFTVPSPSVKSSSDSAMTGSDSEGENDKLPPALRADPNAKNYTYRNFATIAEEPDEPEDELENRKRGNSERSIRIQKFPVKLYAILARQEFSDIITWMPHGRSWKVLKPNAFETLVMPLFFEYSNYHSFNRLVNAWSFRRLSSGPDRGAYYHELFLRGKPHLQRYMRRLPKTHKKLPIKKSDEPDFYKMDKTSPLPDIPDIRSPATVMAMRRQVAAASAGAAASASTMNPSLASQFPGALPTTSRFAAALPLTSLDVIPPMNPLAMGHGLIGSMAYSMPGAFQEPEMPLPPHPLEFASPAAQQHYQYQRMRHLQQLQLFQQHIGNLPPPAASDEELLRFQRQIGNAPPLPFASQGAYDDGLLQLQRQVRNAPPPGAFDEELLRFQQGRGYGPFGR